MIPFDNEGAAGREYLADGIADGVRGKLAALPAVQVIASSSSEEYRRARKPAAEGGRELGVDHVVVGRVRWLKGDRIGLLGVNGAGKSTFAKLMAGALDVEQGRGRDEHRPGHLRVQDGGRPQGVPARPRRARHRLLRAEDPRGLREARRVQPRRRDRLAAETAEFAAKAGVKVSRVGVGDPLSRWGSCSASGGIRYSWRLILAVPARSFTQLTRHPVFVLLLASVPVLLVSLLLASLFARRIESGITGLVEHADVVLLVVDGRLGAALHHPARLCDRRRRSDQGSRCDECNRT